MSKARAILKAALLTMTLALLLPGASALAVEPDEVLQDPELEKRAREISLNLRCVVCQNQSIDDSNAPLAKDLRILVRERLKAGDSNDDVVSFVVARYGEFVLLRPRFALHTLVLWLGPPIVLALALLMVYLSWRKRTALRPAQTPARAKELSPEEQKKLDAFLKDD